MPAYSPAEIHALFRNAFNLGDIEALIALYEPNAILVVDGDIVSGREEIRKAFDNILLQHPRIILETRAAVESQQGLAVLHGRWLVESPMGVGVEVITRRGLSTEVVRRQSDGSWLFVIDNPHTPK